MNFRIRIQEELIERCKKNRNYSLRAFARYLGINPSTLSQILRGKRPVSKRRMESLSARLGLSPSEISKLTGENIPETGPLRVAHNLTLDSFRVIADWYHYAIFELVTVKEFKDDPKWIARTLGITPTEAHLALERLQRLSLVKLDSNQNWHQGKNLITTTGTPITTTAFRKLQKQVLEQAIVALEELPMDIRDQSSMTMAMNKKYLSEVKERIKKFRRELCNYVQQDTDRDNVYQLTISFFPVTKDRKETL